MSTKLQVAMEYLEIAHDNLMNYEELARELLERLGADPEEDAAP